MIWVHEELWNEYDSLSVTFELKNGTTEYTGSTIKSSLGTIFKDDLYEGKNYLYECDRNFSKAMPGKINFPTQINTEDKIQHTHIGHTYEKYQFQGEADSPTLGYGIYKITLKFIRIDGDDAVVTHNNVNLRDPEYPYGPPRNLGYDWTRAEYYDIYFCIGPNINNAYLTDKYWSANVFSTRELNLNKSFDSYSSVRPVNSGNFIGPVQATLAYHPNSPYPPYSPYLHAYGSDGAQDPWNYKWYFFSRESWHLVPSYTGQQIFYLADYEDKMIKVEVYDEDKNFDTEIWIPGASGIYPNPLYLSTHVPETYTLSQNYPNPFNPTTTIEFDLPKTTDVTLKIYNILGEEVATLISDKLFAGSYSYDWSRPTGMASGVYLYRLEAGDLLEDAGHGFVETRKMVLMR